MPSGIAPDVRDEAGATGSIESERHQPSTVPPSVDTSVDTSVDDGVDTEGHVVVFDGVGFSTRAAEANGLPSGWSSGLPLFPPRRCPLMGILVPVAGGIVLDRFFGVSLRLWLVGGVLGWCIWFVAERTLGKSAAQAVDDDRLAADMPWRQRLYAIVPRIMLYLVLVTVSGTWHHLRWDRFPADEIGLALGESPIPVCVEVRALEFPRLTHRDSQDALDGFQMQDQSICLVQMLAVRGPAEWRPCSGRLHCRVAGQLLDVGPGDRLKVFGKLRRPQPAMNPGGFSFDAFERSERRLAMLQVDYPQATCVLSRGNRWSPRWWSAHVREWGRHTLRKYVSAKAFPLAVSILLGDRDQLSRRRIDTFFYTGTIHLLAISGLHVSILASMLFVCARMGILRERWAMWMIMALALSYAVISGGRAPVIRASVLIFILCAGRIMWRESIGMNSLAGAALVVLAMNPCQLFRTGAQLSFLAVAAMIWMVPFLTWRAPLTPIQRLVRRYRTYPQVLASVACQHVLRIAIATFVVWFVTMPLVMNRFHLISPIGLVLNLFVWIPLAIALYSGFCVLVLGWIFPWGAALCGGMCNRSLGWLEAIPTWADSHVHGHFWVAGPSDFAVLMFYVTLAIGLHRFRGRRTWLIGPLSATMVLTVISFASWGSHSHDAVARPPLKCTFLSVGHGSCTVLRFPNHQTWLVDAGSLSASRSSVARISNYLWDQGITHIDCVVLSHADTDHYNAVPGLVTRFGVDRVMVSPVMFASHSRRLNQLRHSLMKAGIPLEELCGGQTLESMGSARIDVLHPTRAWLENTTAQTDNANSLMLSIEAHGHRLLLSGDVEGEGLRWLMNNVAIDVDVALAPHHGSPASRPREFTQWCHPEFVVVSASRAGVGKEGPNAYREQGAEVLHTATSGAIEFTFGVEGISCAEHLKRRSANPGFTFSRN